MWYWVVHCQAQYIVVSALSVYINNHVHETRNNDMTLLICSSAELRPGMFCSVVMCLEHIIGNYDSIVSEYLMDAAFWQLYLRRCLWLAIITVILRLVVLLISVFSAVCPWYGVRFCNCLSYAASILFLRRGSPSCLSSVILSASGDEALYTGALWVKLIIWVRIVIQSVVCFPTGP